MITEEMLIDKVIRQAAEKCAETIISSPPVPEECRHKFSKQFEEKMKSLSSSKKTNYYTAAIHDSTISK